MENFGLVERSDQEEWGKLGALAEAIPANEKTGEQLTREDGEEMREGRREGTGKEVEHARDMKAGKNKEEERRMKPRRRKK
jgi:hypothetical protein